MKRYAWIRLWLVLVLTGLLFTQTVSADPLPNAWQITHNTTAPSSTLYYTNQLTTDQRIASTNDGFRFTVNARFVTDFNDDNETMTMIYGLGNKRFLIWWSLTNNNLTARLENGIRYILTTNGTGNALYHTHEIIYTNGTASYVFDGVVKTNNWQPSGNTWPAGTITWGAGSSSGKAQMNFNRVSFSVTNTMVADYSAGTEPAIAPDPRTEGWFFFPSSLPSGTSTNGISPDRGPGVVTTLADSGYASLRQNIADAQAGDTISFFTNGTIVLTSGQLTIAKNLTMIGPNPATLAISGNNASRVFKINSGVTLSILGLTIKNGSEIFGGGINNDGVLTVTNCAFLANSASGGGGIFNNIGSTNLLINSTFSGNSADSNGGGGLLNGGGVTTVMGCVFSGNATTGPGGGVYHNGGTVAITDSTFAGNSAGNNGGGIYENSDRLTLDNSTLSSNSARQGGGIYNHAGAITIRNTTVSGNAATNSGGSNDGGGIYNLVGTNTLINTTISDNSALNSAGAIYSFGGKVVLTNAIVAGNTASTNSEIYIQGGSITAASCLTNGLPLLAPLGNYGGLTQTMPPLPGSPAIDAGLDSITNSLATDQRGYPRKSGAHVDIGAVEAQPSYIVLNTNDSGFGSLRAAIAAITDRITFTNVLSGQTIHLISGQLTIARGLTIDASALAKGPTLDAGGNSRVLEITNANVTLDSLTFTNGHAYGDGGGILIQSGATLTIENCALSGNFAANNGGGIKNLGSLNLDNCMLSYNSAASDGGGIDNNGTVMLNSSALSGNSASVGGGIGTDGMFTVNDCSIIDNSASYGGGFINFGTLIVNDSTFSGNSATNNGGGIDSSGGGMVTVNNSTLSGNSAFDGGGINNYQSTLMISNCALIDNFASGFGGGISSFQSAGTVNDSTFSGNTSRDGGGLENGSSQLTIRRSTFSGNFATQNGGGLDSTFGTNTLHNCTFAGNSATWSGGGLVNYYGTSALTNCTLVGNSANSGGGIADWGNISTITRVANSIVSGNVGSDVDFSSDSSNRVVSAGHNLIGTGSALASFIQTGDLTNASPFVAPLGNYGGPTQTMPPLAGSPAIDAGLDSITNSLPTDQRGYPRQSGTHVDIGAVELQQTVVINTNDSGTGSLRAAIASVPELVTFASNLSGQTIHLTSGQITLSSNLGIDASSLAGGVIIDAGGTSRVFEIANGDVTLDSLTVTNGYAFDGGGILVDSGVTLTINDCLFSGNSANRGGGIYNFFGILTLKNSNFSGNSAITNGGGLYNNQGILAVSQCSLVHNSVQLLGGGGIFNFYGTLTLKDSTFSENSSVYGGGMDNFGGILAVFGSTISFNSAVYGGGIYNYLGGIATLDDSTVSGNSATNNGGGIYNDSGGDITITNSTFSGNAAGVSGGGLYNNSAGSTIALVDSTVSNNSATKNGGAIALNSSSALTIVSSTLSANFASGTGGGIIIANSSTASVRNSIFSDNRSGGNGGGIYNDSGSDVIITNSTLSGNAAGVSGGGLYNNTAGSTITLVNSTVLNNSATNNGGGIYNDTSSDLTIFSSTLSANHANGNGGGIFILNNGTVTVHNSTLSANHAGGFGGGMANNSGTFALNSSTLSGNSADSGSGGGIYQNPSGSPSVLTNTIVAGNIAAGVTNNIAGTVGLLSIVNCLTSGNPLLAPLGYYGGSTQTMPPLHGSPAIDAGLDSITNSLPADQRGYSRKSGAHVDIGAVESQLASTNNPPRLMNVIWSTASGANSFQFLFTNVVNADFTVLASTNVALPLSQWIILGLPAQNSPGEYSFSDQSATNYPQRFYQVLSP